jgi:hypothetical protein
MVCLRPLVISVLQLWEQVTPKCLWFSTNFTFSLLKTIQGLLAAWLVENIIHSVFFGLKSTGHSVLEHWILYK